jgi:hypothetical protein
MASASAEPVAPSIAANESPMIETLIADAGPLGSDGGVVDLAEGTGGDEPSTTGGDDSQPIQPVTDRMVRRTFRRRIRRSASRRVRNVAATWLHRAERWIRSSELEADRL